MRIKVMNITPRPIELQIYKTYQYIPVKGKSFHSIEEVDSQALTYYKSLSGFRVMEDKPMEILLETHEVELAPPELDPASELIDEDIKIDLGEVEEIREEIPIEITEDQKDLFEDETVEVEVLTADPSKVLQARLEVMESSEIKELLTKADISTRLQNKDRLIEFAMQQDASILIDLLN